MDLIEKLKLSRELTSIRNAITKGIANMRERLEKSRHLLEIRQLLGGGGSQKTLAKAQTKEELSGLMEMSIENQADVKNAFVRGDVDAPIDIVYGNSKMGIAHILQRRAEDGTLKVMTERELLEDLANTVANGLLEKKTLVGESWRTRVVLGESSVLLQKNKGENAWILTGWNLSKETLGKINALSEEEIEKLKRLPLDERKSAFLNLPPTHVNPTRRRINVGANKQPQEDISSETYITADKAVLQQVIDGSHTKINDRALEDELKPIIERAEKSGDKDYLALVDQALTAWEQVAKNAIKAYEKGNE